MSKEERKIYDKAYRKKNPVPSERKAWSEMKQRCLNPKSTHFKYYGGRGITVCERWMNSSKNFLEDMGPKPTPKHSLDRIDSDGNYEPSNCKWSTQREQVVNQRHILKIDGTNCLKDLYKKLGISNGMVARRRRNGMSLEDAIYTPREFLRGLGGLPRKPVIFRGQKFESIRAAAKFFGLHTRKVTEACKYV